MKSLIFFVACVLTLFLMSRFVSIDEPIPGTGV